MNCSIKIKQAGNSDVSEVMTIIRACTEAMRLASVFQWDDIYPDIEQLEEDAKYESLYVARKDNICLGAVSFNENQDEAYQRVEWRGDEPALVVHRLCVDPAFQGQGVAKQLMSFGEKMAFEQGYSSIRLDAYSGNPKAVGFYQQPGYQKVGSVIFPRRHLPFYCFEKILTKRSEA